MINHDNDLGNIKGRKLFKMMCGDEGELNLETWRSFFEYESDNEGAIKHKLGGATGAKLLKEIAQQAAAVRSFGGVAGIVGGRRGAIGGLDSCLAGEGERRGGSG